LLFACSLGGLVLDYTVVSYDEVAVFQPVINGKRCGSRLVIILLLTRTSKMLNHQSPHMRHSALECSHSRTRLSFLACHLTCKIVSETTYNVSRGTLNRTILYHTELLTICCSDKSFVMVSQMAQELPHLQTDTNSHKWTLPVLKTYYFPTASLRGW